MVTVPITTRSARLASTTGNGSRSSSLFRAEVEILKAPRAGARGPGQQRCAHEHDPRRLVSATRARQEAQRAEFNRNTLKFTAAVPSGAQTDRICKNDARPRDSAREYSERAWRYGVGPNFCHRRDPAILRHADDERGPVRHEQEHRKQ